jgi:CRP-like cAMP-binding protein
MDDEQAASIPLLAVLDKRARQNVLRQAHMLQYAPGEAVVREGDPASRLYIIVSGRARVEQSGLGNVATLGPGQFFGELGLIEQHGRTASVVAETELECLALSAWEFKASLREHPEMAVPMLEAIIARLHRKEHHGS